MLKNMLALLYKEIYTLTLSINRKDLNMTAVWLHVKRNEDNSAFKKKSLKIKLRGIDPRLKSAL